MGYFRVMHSRYERKEGKCKVQASSQAKSGGISLPKVCGIDMRIDTNVQSEIQVVKPIIPSEDKAVPQNKPRLGNGMSLPLDKLIQNQPQCIGELRIVPEVSL